MREVLWGCLVAWPIACAVPEADDGRPADPPQAPREAAVATTATDGTTLVVSDLTRVVKVLANLSPGAHEPTDLPPGAAVSRVVEDDEQLNIETVWGVQKGQTLWRERYQAVGTIEVGGPPHPLPEQAEEWLLLPGHSDQRLGDVRQETVWRDDLNANGNLDLFLRVTQNGLPIATGYSKDVPIPLSTPPTGGLPTARAEIAGWRDPPTLVELRYTNTTAQSEAVSLAIQGARGARWTGWGSRHAEVSFEVEPGATVALVDALDPAFHDGYLASAERTQPGAGQGGSGEIRVRRAVPAPGERETFTLTSADIPARFERVRWGPLGRRLYLDWSAVVCQETPYVLLRTAWSMSRAQDRRTIHWTVWSPASNWVQLPPLPPDVEQEVFEAMADPSFDLSISVQALAVETSFARAAGLEGPMTPADVGERSCDIAFATRVR